MTAMSGGISRGPGRASCARLLAALSFAALVAAFGGGCAAPGAPGGAGGSESVVPRTVVPDSSDESDARYRARVRLELAASYAQQRNYSVALDELGQALRADPNYAAAYGLLGLVYMDLGDPRAEESFQRGLRLLPDAPDLNNSYGWFLCRSGREAESIAYFDRAAGDTLYSTPAKPLHNAGICLRKAGDDAAAERYLQRSFQADPSNPVAMFNLGELYLKRGELERARFYAQRLVSSYEPSAETLWLALKVDHALGKRDSAASLGAQLQRLFPASPEAGLSAAGNYSD